MKHPETGTMTPDTGEPPKFDASAVDRALATNDINYIKQLITQGVDLSMWHGQPLTSSVYNSSIEMAEVILEKWPQLLEAKNFVGETPAESKVNDDDFVLAKFYIERGANTNFLNEKPKSSRRVAFFEMCGTPLQHQSGGGYWSFAPEEDRARKVFLKWLLERGIKPQSDGAKKTILPQAVSLGNTAIVEELLNNGLDINGKYKYYYDGGSSDATMEEEATLLDVISCEVHDRRGALSPQYTEMVKLLIKRGIDINSPNQNNYTPLHLFCFNGLFEEAKLLLDAGADPNAISKNDAIMAEWTPSSAVLTVAIKEYLKDGQISPKTKEFISLLKKHGATMDREDFNRTHNRNDIPSAERENFLALVFGQEKPKIAPAPAPQEPERNAREESAPTIKAVTPQKVTQPAKPEIPRKDPRIAQIDLQKRQEQAERAQRIKQLQTEEQQISQRIEKLRGSRFLKKLFGLNREEAAQMRNLEFRLIGVRQELEELTQR